MFGGGNQGSVWESGGQQAGGSGYRSPGGWPEQPPPHAGSRSGRAPQYQGGRPAGSGGGYQGRGTSGRGRRWLRPRRILAIIALVIVVVLVLSGVGYFYLNSKLTRANVLVDYANRPAASDGQNWLITGSDSRQGLSRKQERQLATGRGIGGHRSDTVLMLHIPSSGPAVLVSLPRDSYVNIPGFGMNKLNAAYSFGGPKLLAKTVQNATGLRIDHYMGIGFGGLVNVVDAVGGVRMCIPQNLDDPASGLHLKKGCQNLDGAQALGFVRTRHLFATQDLQREQDQRVFIKALLTKMTSPGTLVNPFTTVPAAYGAAGLAHRGQGHPAVPAHPGRVRAAPPGDHHGAHRRLGDAGRGRRAGLEPGPGAAAVQRDEERPARAQEPDHWLEGRLTGSPGSRPGLIPARRFVQAIVCKLCHIGLLRSRWLPSYHASHPYRW